MPPSFVQIIFIDSNIILRGVVHWSIEHDLLMAMTGQVLHNHLYSMALEINRINVICRQSSIENLMNYIKGFIMTIKIFMSVNN